VSHSPQRKEKDCLNCGSVVQGHYCQDCGQENIEPKETFWHMVTHFFYDITHFDGSFFITLKDLLFKPGFLSKEYVKGRRKAYLHPVRMYVFTSAVFFLIFFSLFKAKETGVTAEGDNPALIEAKEEALKNAKTRQDTLNINLASDIFKITNPSIPPQPPGSNDSSVKKGGVSISFRKHEPEYRSVKEYDSLQKKMPQKDRDNWLVHMVRRKSISLNEKYHGDEKMIEVKLIDKFLHSIPYLLFVSLPLYALFLKLLYVRRRQFYFADHGVFMIHLYIFTFLLMLFYFLMDKINEVAHWKAINVLQVLLLLAGVFYAIKAMHNFYRQGWGKTILKFILFNIMCTITATVLFVLFLFFSFYQV